MYGTFAHFFVWSAIRAPFLCSLHAIKTPLKKHQQEYALSFSAAGKRAFEKGHISELQPTHYDPNSAFILSTLTSISLFVSFVLYYFSRMYSTNGRTQLEFFQESVNGLTPKEDDDIPQAPTSKSSESKENQTVNRFQANMWNPLIQNVLLYQRGIIW